MNPVSLKEPLVPIIARLSAYHEGLELGNQVYASLTISVFLHSPTVLVNL